MRALYRLCTDLDSRPALISGTGAYGAISNPADTAVVAFIHLEPRDVVDPRLAQIELMKTLKLLAREAGTKTLALHRSTHLARKTADAESSQSWLKTIADCLEDAGYRVVQTPYGYFSDMAMTARPRLRRAEAG